MPDTLLAQALSSDERWRILDLLMTRQLSESQVSKILGIRRRVVKAHLAELARVHLVDVVSEKGPSGRTAVVYRVASSARTLGFPPRNYEQLSEALIAGLASSLGEKSAKMILRDIGQKVGEEMGKSLLTNANSETLTMKEYGDLFVNGLMAAQHTYPRILHQGSSEIVYEQFNCPFQELADKMPGLICDVLDEAVHGGLDNALGVKSTKLSCRGHGAPTCRFRVVPAS